MVRTIKKNIVTAENLTIYIIGRNTSLVGLVALLNLKKFYPELEKCLVYVDDNSDDDSEERITENHFRFIKTRTTEKDIFEFNTEGNCLGSIRNILAIKQVLSDCETDFAIIMHSDMYIINNHFLYEMFDDMNNYKVSSLALLTHNERDNFIKDSLMKFNYHISNSDNEIHRKYREYYRDHIIENGINNVWAGLTLINLKYFKDNNLPFCDRLDERNKYCVSYLFSDTMQDFQCFLIENNIPFKTYNIEDNNCLIHIGSKSFSNSYYLGHYDLAPENNEQEMDEFFKTIKVKFHTKEMTEKLNVILEGTNIRKKALLSDSVKKR